MAEVIELKKSAPVVADMDVLVVGSGIAGSTAAVTAARNGARTMVVDSATSQFFINLVDNGFLDHRDETARGFGYCVFGKVTAGMDVVDKIGKVKTGRKGAFNDVPVEPVIIKSIRRAPAD